MQFEPYMQESCQAEGRIWSLIEVLSWIYLVWKSCLLEQLSLLSLMRVHTKIFLPSFFGKEEISQTISHGNEKLRLGPFANHPLRYCRPLEPHNPPAPIEKRSPRVWEAASSLVPSRSSGQKMLPLQSTKSDGQNVTVPKCICLELLFCPMQ